MPVGLGIDLGTTNTKVAAISVHGSAVRVDAVATAPTPTPARLGETLRALLGTVRARRPEPDAVGIASMAETGVPLDTDGAPVGDWLRWDAGRSSATADELAARLGWTELVRATGVRPSGKVPLATWAHLHRHDPTTWSAFARWAGVADLACLLLTGRLATDHTLAGRTMAYRLPHGDRLADGFDAALLAETGLRPAQLPDVVAPGETAGVVIDSSFELPVGTPVVVAGHDHAVGAWASGVRRPGDVADSLGTAEAVLTIVADHPDAVAVARAGMSTVVTVAGDRRAILAGSPGAGAVVDWWLAHEAGGHDAAQLFAGVLAAGDGPGDAVVLPYPSGRQAPHPDAAARLHVVGRRTGHTPVQLARALLDGLSLQARWLLDAQAELAGAGPATVTVFGAPAADNPAWLRTKVHVTPCQVRVVDVQETVAAGAALRALSVAGFLDDPLPCLPCHDEPADAEVAAAYELAYAGFVAAAMSAPATAEGGAGR